MSSSASRFPLSSDDVRRYWRLASISGALGVIYGVICVDGTQRAKFLTDLHATPFDFALISALFSFTYIFQIVCGLFTRHFRSRKVLWFLLSLGNRLLFLGVLAAPLFAGERFRIWWIIVVLFVAFALGQASLPVWYAWMSELVPQESLNRHWAVRQRFTTWVRIAIALAMAAAFWHFERIDRFTQGYFTVYIIGVIIGVCDIIVFMRIPEPPPERTERGAMMPALMEPLRDRTFRPFLAYMCYWQVAVMVAAPFFALYMLKCLHMSASAVLLVMTAETVGIAVASRFWGLVCDTYGQRPVLQMGVFGKAVVTLGLILVPPIQSVALPLLCITFFLNGLLTASTNLGTQGVLLKNTPRANRSTYIGVTNFVSGSVAAITSIVAGYFIQRLEKAGVSREVGIYTINGYHVVFVISTALRLSTYWMAARLHEPQSLPVQTVMAQLRTTNSLKVVRMVYRLADEKSETVRGEICRRLGAMRSPLAIKDLIRALDDSSHMVRGHAADALGQIGVAEATGALARALCDPASGIQSPAARALGQIGGFHSLRALLGNLRNLSHEALGETVDALARIGDRAAILPLICLYDEVQDEALRGRIAVALGRLGDLDPVADIESILSVSEGDGRYR